MFQMFMNKRECCRPHNLQRLIVVGILLGMATSPAYASTLDAYAAYRSTAGKIIPEKFGKIIEKKLQDQGFIRGKTALLSPKVSASPLLYVDQNTNGGNPKKPLTIGNLTFNSQPDLQKRSGILAGFRANLKYRHSTGWGKYLDFNASASESISISSSDKVKGSSFTLCSVNYIQNWTYLDACYSEANNEKELSSSTFKSRQITFSRHFDLTDGMYSKASLGFQETNYGNYDQTSVTVGLKTLSQKHRVTIELQYGDQPSLPTQHSLKYSGKISSNFNFMRRSGQISFSAAKYGRSQVFVITGFPLAIYNQLNIDQFTSKNLDDVKAFFVRSRNKMLSLYLMGFALFIVLKLLYNDRISDFVSIGWVSLILLSHFFNYASNGSGIILLARGFTSLLNYVLILSLFLGFMFSIILFQAEFSFLCGILFSYSVYNLSKYYIVSKVI